MELSANLPTINHFELDPELRGCRWSLQLRPH